MAKGSRVIPVVLASPDNSNENQPLDRLMLFDENTGLPINPGILLMNREIIGESLTEVQDKAVDLFSEGTTYTFSIVSSDGDLIDFGSGVV